jgi:hypothetical protein
MLEQEEKDWFKHVLLGDVSHPRSIILKPSQGVNWKICLEEEDFRSWYPSQRKSIIFFDKASKGNPGLVDVRGIILDHDGKQEESFE